MSPIDFRSERMHTNEVNRTIREIIKDAGNVDWSPHALQRLMDRGLTTVDVLNVLKSPDSKVTEPSDFEKGSWRYRYSTERITVVISFSMDGKRMRVVTMFYNTQKR